MKKKKRLNSKIIFTITMVFVLCFFMLTSLWTAKKNDFNSAAVTASQSQPPIADFIASKTKISMGESVTFTDTSVNNPTSWSWTFECGDPATSEDSGPITVRYDAVGKFDVTLEVTNAYGSDSETKVDYIEVVYPYCESSGNPYYFHIEGVELADLDNPSEDSTYSDFTHLTAHLTQGKTYGVLIEQYRMQWELAGKIWIDYNGDYDFDDAGEEVFSGSGIFTVNGSISVPCCTIIGDTRMRVTLATTPRPPCGDTGYGEVEDYTVNIASNPNLDYTVGNTDVFAYTSTSPNRRARPYTMPEDGAITSISMYHEGNECGNGYKGDMILAVYGDEGDSPNDRIAVTEETTVSGSADWQTIPLESPVCVQGDTPIWLAWVYENNPGIRYKSGAPGRAEPDENKTWAYGMPDPFGSSSQKNYIYSIYATYIHFCTVGYSDMFGSTSTSANRRAMPFTMPVDGTITGISMYHVGGSGNMTLAVYDGEGYPQNLLTSESDEVSSTTGWQTIDLENPVCVQGGTPIWLAWVYEDNPGIRFRYKSGAPGRVDAGEGWSGGMPDPFGCGSKAQYIYSIYAKYNPCACDPTYRYVGNNTKFGMTTDNEYRQAMPFTMPEDGTIKSVTMYHNGGSGDMILAVYADDEGSPDALLAETEETTVCENPGWQTIALKIPKFVQGDTPIWLAWVYQSNPGIRRKGGSPGSYQSGETWSGGMPDPFGNGTHTNYIYSIYATYTVD